MRVLLDGRSALGTFEIFGLTDGHLYAKLAGATDGRLDVVPGCEGVVIDLDALWAELERLAEQ